MIRSAIGKVMWVGRATVFLVGLSVILALLFGVAATALAGTGVGAPFNLGQANTVNKISSLIGSASGAMLKIDNNGAVPALALQVEPGKQPLTVNSNRRVARLNADNVDGLDSAQLVQGGGKIHRFGSVDMNSGDDPRNLTAVGPFTLQGRCRELNSTTELFLRNDSSGPWSFAVNSSNGANPALAAQSDFRERALIGTLGNGKSVTASGYAHALSVDKQIFFEVYQYRVADFFNNESCTFGGYVVEG